MKWNDSYVHKTFFYAWSAGEIMKQVIIHFEKIMSAFDLLFEICLICLKRSVSNISAILGRSNVRSDSSGT